MEITLNEKYSARSSSPSLGYVGETNARTITFSGYETDGAQAYKMRLEYADRVSYEIDISDGTYTIEGSLLRMAGEVKAQILAYALDGKNYTLVKKSNVFKLKIKPSLEDEPAPIPTYEQSAGALEKVLASEASAASSAEKAERAKTAAQSAETAAETAKNTAVQSAASALKSAENASASETAAKNAETVAVAKSAEISESLEQIGQNKDNIAELRSDIDLVQDIISGHAVESWADVQKIVRAGQAAKYFSVGDQFICKKTDDDGTVHELVWDVIGIDCEVPSDSRYEHSLTLQLHDCYQNAQFDSAEALYFAESGLSAGTYCFTVQAGYDDEYGGGKTYHFTLTQPVPAGGFITFPWGLNTQAISTKISTYADAVTATAIEKVSVEAGSAGTDLGTTDGNSENVNHIQRARFGSNNWLKSDMRQRINSDAAVGADEWERKTKYSRKPVWNNSNTGFLRGIDADFLCVIGKVKKVTARNTVTDGGGYDTSDELMFLLSRSEVYGGKENNIEQGAAYPYYSENSDLSAAGTGSDANRIKELDGTAQPWRLRSPVAVGASTTRHVGASGVVGSFNAYNTLGLAPACSII
ncbi:MAG: DUF6273 domain-containing protein [Ruminococcus sp.]|nr:DUF6273 domain-containing protein [Ruminococcus sp.]